LAVPVPAPAGLAPAAPAGTGVVEERHRAVGRGADAQPRALGRVGQDRHGVAGAVGQGRGGARRRPRAVQAGRERRARGDLLDHRRVVLGGRPPRRGGLHRVPDRPAQPPGVAHVGLRRGGAGDAQGALEQPRVEVGGRVEHLEPGELRALAAGEREVDGQPAGGADAGALGLRHGSYP
jgi:hypothetical protein